MNAAKAVRNVGKKGLNVAKDSVVQIQSIPHVVVSAVIVLLLIVYSAVVVNYVPFKFLAFFENIIVKIVVLVVIAFVGLYCPAIALFLAIALIVTLQMAQKKRMTGDVTTEKMTPQAAMNNSDTSMHKDKHGSTMKHGKVSMKHGKMMESMEDYLDPALMDGTDDDVNNQDQPMPSETFESMSNMGSDLPLGYNNDSSCIGSCGGNMGNPAISSQCGAVKTWNNQMSAQGLGTDIPGIQPSVGYPVA